MKRTLFAVIGAVALAGGVADAHHSYADFFQDQTVSIEGEIEEVLYANPHVVLKVLASDANTYKAEWQAATQLARAGVVGTTLKVGDHVIVRGCPSRDTAAHRISLLKEVRRPADGWQWSRHW